MQSTKIHSLTIVLEAHLTVARLLQAVTAALLQMTEHSSELLLPTLEAISNISSQDTTQVRVCKSLQV